MNTALTAPGKAEAQSPHEPNAQILGELRKRMHENAGVLRNAAGIGATLDWIERSVKDFGRSRALVASKLILAAALSRQESRGGHYRSDFPETRAPHRTFVRAGGDGEPQIRHSAMAEGN
jgi:L-aspartate oxidase